MYCLIEFAQGPELKSRIRHRLYIIEMIRLEHTCLSDLNYELYNPKLVVIDINNEVT